MSILDRYILRALIFNYLIALSIMMSLYIVLDLFFNMDEFTEAGRPTMQIAANIAGFYGTNLFRYFAQLSGVITLFACMLTLARMRKLNELTAMLSSGISLYRAAAPVLAFGILTSVLWYVDTEWIIPSLAHKLARKHEECGTDKTYGVWFLNDRDDALLSAQEFLPRTGELKRLLVLERDRGGRLSGVVQADRAVWESRPGHPFGGWWNLTGGKRRVRLSAAPEGIALTESVQDQPLARYESELTPEDIESRQSAQWTRYLSSAQLARLAERGSADALSLQQVMHSRFATPIVDVLMLLLGIPIIMNRLPALVLTDSGKCLGMAGLCFLVAFLGQNVIRSESFPALPAWLPLILFVPIAAVLLDRMKT